MQEATSFGPVLTDRAETLGKRRIFVGVSYEYFDFDKADNVNLKNFGAVYTHEPEPTECTGPTPPLLHGTRWYPRAGIRKRHRYHAKPNRRKG